MDLPYIEFLSKMNYDNIIDEDFTIEEIEASIKKLKPKKTAGLDGLQSEHLKFGGPLRILTRWLQQFFALGSAGGFLGHSNPHYRPEKCLKLMSYPPFSMGQRTGYLLIGAWSYLNVFKQRFIE